MCSAGRHSLLPHGATERHVGDTLESHGRKWGIKDLPSLARAAVAEPRKFALGPIRLACRQAQRSAAHKGSACLRMGIDVNT